MTQIENNSFISGCKNYIIICAVFIAVAVVVALSCPSKSTQKFLPVVKAASEVENEVVAEFGALIHEVGFKSEKAIRGDDGLALYRQPSSKGAVEWFYLHVTGNRDVSLAILEEAEKNGDFLVIRPPEKLPVGRVEHNPDKLQLAYDIGRETALKQLEEIKEFVTK